MVAIFHPKGGMCAVCEHVSSDCSDLRFNEMRPLKTYNKEGDPNIFKIVKCTEFKRK